MIFTKLAGLLAGNSAINLLITGTAEALSVTVIPKPAKAEEGQEALSTPLNLTGTAAELDAEFATYLESYTGARKSLAEQFEATAAVLEAAKKESANKAVTAVTKTAKSVKAPPAAKAEQSDNSDTGDDGGDGTGNSVAPASASAAATPAAPDNLFC